MSGTINLALTQQFDAQGDPLSGGLLGFFQAGTVNPQNAFQDFGLAIPHPNPIVLDASGRVPMFYLADGFIKIRLTDKNGVAIIAADQMLVIGPSVGTSGGAGFDPNAVLTTGDIKARYGTGTITGFVRCNGNTIGQTGSSATEIGGVGQVAQALYEYLWGLIPTSGVGNIRLDDQNPTTGLPVKGANAPADFGALRRLVLPDLRGRTIAGLDDMGAAVGAASRLTSTYFGVAASGPSALGAAGGDEKRALAVANLIEHTHALQSTGVGALGTSASSIPTPDGGHSHTITQTNHSHGLPGTPIQDGGNNIFTQDLGSITTRTVAQSLPADSTDPGQANITINTTNSPHDHAITTTLGGTTQKTGSAVPTPLAVANPAMVLTFYIKL